MEAHQAPPSLGFSRQEHWRVGCHFLLQCMKVKSEREVSQSCPTLRDPMNYSLPGSSIRGIFQARVLEWGAITFSSHPSRLLQRPILSSLSHTANSHWLCILYMVVYMFPCYFLHSSHHLLPPPACVHKSHNLPSASWRPGKAGGMVQFESESSRTNGVSLSLNIDWGIF